jgi:hypothetical protein
MEQSASEAKSTLSRSINSTNPKFNYRAHNSPMRSQINPIHALKSYFLNIYLNIILQPSGLFRLSFPTKILYSFVVAFKRINKSKAVPLHAMEALGGRGCIAPTHSRPRH